MVNLSTSPKAIKRGSFAADLRTGQIVKVAEIGGRDVMVKPAYKSDGIWVGPENLAPASDPHAWTLKHLLLALLALAVSAGISYGNFQDLTDHGLGAADAVWEGAFPTGTFVLICLGQVFGLTRA